MQPQQKFLVPLGKDAAPAPQQLGQKGAGLVLMHALGLPVPPGVVLSTAFFAEVRKAGGVLDDALWSRLWSELSPACDALCAEAEAVPVNRPRRRVAVRSAPTVSMPGIMDSVLDVDLDAGPAALRAAIESVLRSADAPRARDYRRLYGLPEPLDVAVVIQAMVYGDRGANSAAGVLFTRDPSTGEPTPFGEYLPQARGDDVVSGRLVPRPLVELAQKLPQAYAALIDCGQRLERHLGDVQDIEFTVEEDRLWLLQTRAARRSARAMVRIAVELCREGIVSQATALSRIEPRRLGELLRPTVDATAERTLLVRGLPASPGAVSGRIVFSSADVEARARAGEATLLVRADTSPEDIVGIKLCSGLLTARGGMTSHAAVLARGLGRCAVVGASGLTIDAARQQISTREHTVRRGDVLTLDGNTGEVFVGEVPLVVSHLAQDPQLVALLALAEPRRLRAHALIDNAAERAIGRALPADGLLERQAGQLTLLCKSSPAKFGIEVCNEADLASVAATGIDFILLSADLNDGLAAAVTRLRAAHPTLPLGLATTRLHSDEVEAVERATTLALDFVACSPLRVAVAIVAAAQATTAGTVNR